MKIESLRFENLTLQYSPDEKILNNVEIELPTHQVVWVKSSEGQGKSSVLSLIAGLTQPTSGKYLMNDIDTVPLSFEEFLPLRLHIGYSFDYGGLLSNRTLIDNLTLPLLYHKFLTPNEAQFRAEGMLARFNVEKYAQERPAHVPGRVRKIACLLRSFIHNPELLVMDDPSVGIGAESSETLVEMLQELRQDGYINHLYISTYDSHFMERFGSHSAMTLAEGNLFVENEQPLRKVVHL